MSRDLSTVDLALLFSRLDRFVDALRLSNNDLFDSGGAPDVAEHRRQLLNAIWAIDDELGRRRWPATSEIPLRH